MVVPGLERLLHVVAFGDEPHRQVHPAPVVLHSSPAAGATISVASYGSASTMLSVAHAVKTKHASMNVVASRDSGLLWFIANRLPSRDSVDSVIARGRFSAHAWDGIEGTSEVRAVGPLDLEGPDDSLDLEPANRRGDPLDLVEEEGPLAKCWRSRFVYGVETFDLPKAAIAVEALRLEVHLVEARRRALEFEFEYVRAAPSGSPGLGRPRLHRACTLRSPRSAPPLGNFGRGRRARSSSMSGPRGWLGQMCSSRSRGWR